MVTGSIKLLRLVTGEDILAEVVEDSKLGISPYKLKNPIRVIMIQDANTRTQPRVAFGPWYEFSKDTEVELDRSHVLFTLNPVPQFIEHYKSMFSNIIMPQSSSIVLPKH